MPPNTPPGQNPYEFITNPGKPARKSLLPGGSSTKGRIIIVVAGALILLMLVVIVIGILGSSGNGLKDDYLSLAQQQAELIRVSNIGLQQAQQSQAKNLAILVEQSLTSEQAATLSVAKKAGADVSAKSLALGQNSKTDSTLNSAAQSNQFDATFIDIMKTNLQKYQQTLKQLYSSASGKTAQATLSADYENANQLLNQLK